MECSTLGFGVHQYLPESAQTHVHLVGGAIQPFHPLLPCHGLLRPGLVDWSQREEGRRGPKSRVKQGYFIYCRNACLYIFNKVITQPLKRMKFHQLQQNG